MPHPDHPYVISPDGNTVICYNESTLRRFAEEKGIFFVFIIYNATPNTHIFCISSFHMAVSKSILYHVEDQLF